jgi:hypothetical protein
MLPKHLLQFRRLHITRLLKNEPQQIDIGPVLVDCRQLPQPLDLAQVFNYPFLPTNRQSRPCDSFVRHCAHARLTPGTRSVIAARAFHSIYTSGAISFRRSIS